MDAGLMSHERPRVPSAPLVSISAATNQSPDVPGSRIICKMVQIRVFTLLALRETHTHADTHGRTHIRTQSTLFSSSWVQEALGVCVCARVRVCVYACVCVRVRHLSRLLVEQRTRTGWAG